MNDANRPTPEPGADVAQSLTLPQSAAARLFAAGVGGAGDGDGIFGSLTFERPCWPQAHRLKDCVLGAFTFFNAAGMTSAYRVRFGRYSQIGESSIIGPPEHPQSWFSSHPFAFTRPSYTPGMYAFEEFTRLAPGNDAAGPDFAATMPNETVIGHEAYVGAGSFIKRGVTIGDGAIIGARSVITRDIPAYAIAVGSPARVIRLRFADALVERFIKLQWWRYDLAPFRGQVDYSDPERALDFFEQKLADGGLQPLMPVSYKAVRSAKALTVDKLPTPLFFV